MVTLATPSGNDSGDAEKNKTKDHVFLLSPTEAEKYFPSDESRRCNKTDYAGEQSCDKKNQLWKLRTASDEWDYIVGVNGIDGKIVYAKLRNRKGDIELREYSLRPAIWIKL